MVGCKVPKDCVVVNSKSHPGRKYLYNVTTKKSIWIPPTSDKTDKISLVNDKTYKNYEEGEGSSKKLTYKNNASSTLPKTWQRKETNKTNTSSPKSFSSKLAKCDKSISSMDKNKNQKTCTPQMSVLYDRIRQRNWNTPGLYKKGKSSTKSKQHKKDTGPEENINQNNNTGHEENQKKDLLLDTQNISKKKDEKCSLRKNLAKQRMNNLRRSLSSLNKDILKEIGSALKVTEKASQNLNKSLPNSSNSDSLGSMCSYKNDDVQHKGLYNKASKNSIYEKTDTLNRVSQVQEDKVSVLNLTTENKLIEPANQEVQDEEMDWEPMNDEEITLEVEVVRTQISRKCIDETNCISGNTVELTELNRMESQEKDPLYIVIDTNVFLTNLQIVEEARDMTFKNYSRPIIVIPWTVIYELDYFKANKSKRELWEKARKAISFIHGQFSSKHPRIIGQTREQAIKNKEDFVLNCPDDEILQCCLQIRKLQKSVVLLSYDKNLGTKAMIHDIMFLGRHDSLEKIDYFNMNNKAVSRLTDDPGENDSFNEFYLIDNIFEDIKAIMKDFLSTIIVEQMSEIYGAARWEMYVIIKPPWTIVTALKCAIKHWIAAINESFQYQRRTEHILKELLQAFEHAPASGRKLQDMAYILEKCSELVQTVNRDKHLELWKHTLNTIVDLDDKCLKHIIDINQKKLYNQTDVAENVQGEEIRAEKAFKCFQYTYNYALHICLACSNAEMACTFPPELANPPLTHAAVQSLRPEIARKVTELTQNLNKLLNEDTVKCQKLFTLEQNLNTFLPDAHMTFDVALLDIYYCVKLRKAELNNGLKELQELDRNFCALPLYT